MLYLRPSREGAPVIVEARGLRQRFGQVEALRGVDFVAEGPGIWVLLGPNGAGTTTLLSILEGLASPDAGTLRLFGAPASPSRYPRRKVGVVLQREFVPEGMTAREYAELFAALFDVPGRGAAVLSMARLEHRRDVAVARLSGGEAARLFVCAAYVHEPPLFFLDEPAASLDPENKRLLGALFVELARRSTLVLSTHDLGEAERLATQLIFLVEGQIRAAGPKEELLASLPEGTPRTVEAAFFHHAGSRITARGELE